MRVLVTGGAGFIGGHVTSALLDAGHEVRVLDCLLPQAWRGAKPDVDARAQFVVGDAQNAALVRDVLDGVDVVCHHAAMVGMGIDAADLPAFVANNDLAIAVVLAAMTAKGVSRLVLASSMVVYGEGAYTCPTDGPARPAARHAADLDAGQFDPTCSYCDHPLEWTPVAESAPLEPRSSYAATKTAQEHLAAAWQRDTGGDVAALRYHNVYGPRMPRDTPYAGVAAIFRSALEAHRAPAVFEDGRQMRDFVHVFDVARANVLAVEKEWAAEFSAVNIASGHPISILEMADAICNALGGPPPTITGRYRAGDVRHIVASPTRAADTLGFHALITPREGLRDFASAPLRG